LTRQPYGVAAARCIFGDVIDDVKAVRRQ